MMYNQIATTAEEDVASSLSTALSVKFKHLTEGSEVSRDWVVWLVGGVPGKVSGQILSLYMRAGKNK